MSTKERLKKELKNYGYNLSRLANEIKVSYATIQRRMQSGEFTDQEIIDIGRILEKIKGNPSNVWPEYQRVKEKQLFGSDLEIMPDYSSRSVPVHYTSIYNKPESYVLIPQMAKVELFVQVNGIDSFNGIYQPGTLYGIRKVNNIEEVIFGSVYFVACKEFESLRVITQITDKNKLILKPINPEFKEHGFDLRKSLDIYKVFGGVFFV